MPPRKPVSMQCLVAGHRPVASHLARARAQSVLPLSSPGNQSVIEGDSLSMTFQVANTTGNTLILDYALATITPLGPDFSDSASFAGSNGSNGLASANLYLLPGQIGVYSYNVSTPPVDVGPDYGDNRFDFYIEFHNYLGPLSSLPPTNNISSAIGFVAFMTPQDGYSEDGNAYNTLSGFTPLNFGTTLFQNTNQGSQPTDGVYVASTMSFPGDPNPFDKSPIIRVADVPEPSGLILLGTAACLLLGYAGRRRVARVGQGA